MSNNIPNPILRKEKYLAKIAENTAGGGAEPTVLMANKNITENGVVNPDSGFDGFAKVTVDVPNTYSAGDEGKVVSNGALVTQTSKTVTQNDTYTTTTNNQVIVNVPNTYTVSDEGKVVSSGALVSQTSTNITSNGTVDTTLYNSAVVNVPNTYSAGDEGKVVSSGALTAQTSRNVTVNDTYDTTLNNSVTVNVPAPTLITKSITSNGTYTASSDSADGYSSVDVSVPNTYSAGDEGKVVSNGALVSQTSTNINSNGTHTTTTNNEVVVAVPNTYTAGDEGKVVDSGALVAQTAYPSTITQNDTYDTTNYNSITVDVQGSATKSTSAMCWGNSSYTTPTDWYISVVDINNTKKLVICAEQNITSTGTVTRYIKPEDLTLSDYMSENKTVTIYGYYFRRQQSGGTWENVGYSSGLTLVINPTNNTITFTYPTTSNGYTLKFEGAWTL